MFAMDGAVPAPVEVVTCNCTGLTNLMLRAIGTPLPYHEVIDLFMPSWN
jgi:hypothetical protein